MFRSKWRCGICYSVSVAGKRIQTLTDNTGFYVDQHLLLHELYAQLSRVFLGERQIKKGSGEAMASLVSLWTNRIEHGLVKSNTTGEEFEAKNFRV